MSKLKKKVYQEEAEEFTRIFERAIQKAQAENRQFGLPDVFSKNGEVYFRLPDGKIVNERPRPANSMRIAVERILRLLK
ncbi:hypothetical protein EHQ81_13740 [Leptospira selangorensis]|uniref:Uncharacterized protein n=1 Tax=Leptospira selangorensis TaxID=2484982 RepID=A0A5F2BXM6_9LEPT|nr:hypothetical protein [Leptospira selangorensis]TGM12130.1 hypothetical protein EHQ81_13740 [Leptospira selangorensis]TGM14827.1 hypothetical protein EHQ82_18870 [Leptospira selangorensis]